MIMKFRQRVMRILSKATKQDWTNIRTFKKPACIRKGIVYIL